MSVNFHKNALAQYLKRFKIRRAFCAARARCVVTIVFKLADIQLDTTDQ